MGVESNDFFASAMYLSRSKIARAWRLVVSRNGRVASLDESLTYNNVNHISCVAYAKRDNILDGWKLAKGYQTEFLPKAFKRYDFVGQFEQSAREHCSKDLALA
jgi:hypothetical protein